MYIAIGNKKTGKTYITFNNLNDCKLFNKNLLKNVGAIFIPFSPDIIAFALEDHTRKPNDNYHYLSHVYERLGYTKILGLE